MPPSPPPKKAGGTLRRFFLPAVPGFSYNRHKQTAEELLVLCRQTVLEFENYNHYLVEKNTYRHDVFIGVASDSGVKFMMRSIPEFSKLHPNINVNFLQFPSNRLLEQLRNGAIDFVRMAYDQPEPDLDYTKLTEARVDLIVPLNHPLAKDGGCTASDSNATVRLKDIQRESLVLPNQTTVLRKILQNYFEANHFEPKIEIEVATSFSALIMRSKPFGNGIKAAWKNHCIWQTISSIARKRKKVDFPAPWSPMKQTI